MQCALDWLANPKHQDDSMRSMCTLNSRMKNDSRVEYVLLDGLVQEVNYPFEIYLFTENI